MALLVPFYLAVGSCILENGSGATGYVIPQPPSFPAPAPDGQGGHLPATRSFNVHVTAATIAACRMLVNTLAQQAVRDNYLSFGLANTEVRECRIREASVVEAASAPLTAGRTTAPFIDVTVTLTTDPYWLAPWGEWVSPTVSAVPGHFDVTDPGGEADALMTTRIVPTSAGRGLFVGVKPNPASGYDYLDDYGTTGDTADNNALGGYKKGAVADATLSEDVTAPTIDTNANRGSHIALVRLDSTATTAGSNSVKSRVTTTGNAIASSVSADGRAAVAFTANDLIGYELGNVRVPAGHVPDVATGSGYSTPEVAASQTTHDYSDSPALGEKFDSITAGTRIVSCTFRTGTVTTPQSVTFGIFSVVGSAMSQLLAESTPVTVSASNTDYTFYFYYDVPTTAAYAIFTQSGFTGIDWRYNGSGGYTGGSLIEPNGAFMVGQDAYFILTTSQQLGFNTTMPVLLACTESSKTLALDYAQRIPTDYACLAYRKASGALGIYYDADTDTPYEADVDGIGPAVYDKCEVRRPLRLKPGVTNRVVLGILQEDTAVAGFDALSYRIRKRYLTATG